MVYLFFTIINIQTLRRKAETSIWSALSYFRKSLKLTELSAGQATPEVFAL